MSRNDVIISAAEQTIIDGAVLHVRAQHLTGRRSPRRDGRHAVDLTVGPASGGGFLVVDYSLVRAGVEERHETAHGAVRSVRRALSWDRIESMVAALCAVHGEPEMDASRFVEESRTRAAGTRLNAAFGHRPSITGPLFGPTGHGLR